LGFIGAVDVSDQLSINLFCPHCGQKLSLPTVDLRRSFRCPRCQVEERAADLVPPAKTVPAVPIASIKAPEVIAGPRMDVPQVLACPPPAPPAVMTAPSPGSSLPLEFAASPPASTALEPRPAAPASLPLRIVRFILHCAERFDALSYGHRDKILYTLAGIYCFSVVGSLITKVPTWERVALAVFFFVLGAYGLARLALFRREDGRWTWRSAASGLSGSWRRARDWFSDWRELPPEARRASWTTLLVMGGCVSIAIRGGFEWMLVPKNSIGFTVWAFAGWLAIAVGLYRWYKFRSPRAPRAKELPGAAALCARAAGLPPVLDLVRNRDAALHHARVNADDYLYTLLTVLSEWKPRPRGEPTELDYQDSLHRHLRKRAPGLRVERERPIDAIVEGTRRRLDLAIDGRVVIELKRHLRRTADADRAFGQLRGYAKAWPHGPILLVLCETGDEFAHQRDLQGKIEALRSNDCAVIAVAAGRRTSA
jgi:hypothetical protein